ncbi:MAG TPA: hypothetical protein VJ521_06095 [Acidobacteriota bacterium]|nr:hypothetical protein [Acidobacteriota bacterium]
MAALSHPNILTIHDVGAEADAWLNLLNCDQLWDPLRNDPRFQDLLRRMNFGEPEL